ncbi:hypothetical protein GQ54DRAFT_299559 [Martensiomyces pterosporus]|nr:hypothetical protein GQ54DRAFT_299559 [Martensiomyces pterosporus]
MCLLSLLSLWRHGFLCSLADPAMETLLVSWLSSVYWKYIISIIINARLNSPAVQQELGAEVDKFESCNQSVYAGFLLKGHLVLPFHREIPPLLDAGIRVLIYNGDADWICNWYGGKAWALNLEWPGNDAFNDAEDLVWNVAAKQAGEVRSFANFTLPRVFEAGHMAPYDQPENTLTMINRWLANRLFATSSRR